MKYMRAVINGVYLGCELSPRRFLIVHLQKQCDSSPPSLPTLGAQYECEEVR